MKAKGYNKAEAVTGGDYVQLPAGGYVCKIEAVEDNGDEDKPYLGIQFDIAEGEYAGFFDNDWGRENPWSHSFRQYYSEKALGMFKGFIQNVDASNGTDFDSKIEKGFDEQLMVGKLVGLIISYEEYISNRGEVKQRMRVKSSMTVVQIHEGKFKVPELKRLEESTPAAAPTVPQGFVPDPNVPF